MPVWSNKENIALNAHHEHPARSGPLLSREDSRLPARFRQLQRSATASFNAVTIFPSSFDISMNTCQTDQPPEWRVETKSQMRCQVRADGLAAVSANGAEQNYKKLLRNLAAPSRNWY
jgi:hypothetical protein